MIAIWCPKLRESSIDLKRVAGASVADQLGAVVVAPVVDEDHLAVAVEAVEQRAHRRRSSSGSASSSLQIGMTIE